MCREGVAPRARRAEGLGMLDVVATASVSGSCWASYESVGVIADAIRQRMENHIVADAIGPAAGPSVTRHRGSLPSEQCRCRYH